MTQNVYRSLWFTLFAVLARSGKANSPSSRTWGVCSSHEQCQNGGSCLNKSCLCAYGYTGPICEYKQQCNKNFACQNNGTCEVDWKTNTSFCRCNQYSASDGRFVGGFCERKAPCHAIGYCLNDGVCQRDPYVDGAFFCQCREGFSGPDCQEITMCREARDCLKGAKCINNKCSCDGDGYTGHFCELEVTPALKYSTVFYWPFNRLHPGMKGAAKVVRDIRMGNVLDLMQAGGGWVDLGQVNNSCLEDLSKCQEGISVSFWLQFTNGRQVITLINNDNTILSVYVKDYRNILISLKVGSNTWNIERHCFPMGWFHLTITWNHRKLRYYENGHQVRVSSPSSALIREDASPFGNSTKLSVGGIQGQGGFSTLRMSDLAFWTRALRIEEVGDVYKKKLSSPLTTRCLSAPCPSDQWCEYVSSNSSNFTCMKPAGFYCSFDNASCQWQNLSHNINFWRIYNEYGSLRHDHTGNSCTGSREFLGLVSNEGRVNSEVISPIFSKSSVLWNKVSISMWYYMEGWTSKTLYVILQTSAEDKELFAVKQRQNRRWTYLRVKVPVISSFRVILRGEINGSGGIFVDDISVETFSSPTIIPRELHFSTTLYGSTSLVCTVHKASNITWYRNNNPIQQDNHYTIYNEMRGDKNVSVLEVTGINCQLTGNYTCVTANQFGSVQRQLTLSILDVPRPPSKVMIDRYSKRIRWTEEPGYECLPKSYFVVEYKKNLSKNWTFAGYFDHGVFDLVNVSKGEKFNVRIFAKNVIGSSPASLITFWTNIKPSEIQLFVNDTAVQNSERIVLHRGAPVTLTCVVKAEPAPTRFILKFPSQHNVFINSQHRINGIKWQIILRLKSMNCFNTGSYSFEPHNRLGSNGSVSVKLAISEPDPPKKFNVTFINITSVVISWWAYLCNEALPRELRVRYRQQGSAVWTVTKYKYPSRKMVLRRQFKYKTEYEFKVSIAYNGLRSRYSSVVKIRSPADITKVTMTSNFTGPANRTLIIYCFSVNLTAVSFSWTKDSVTLQASYRMKFDVNSMSSVLTIRFTKKTDSGNYTCKVSNSKIILEETIAVSVSEPPRVHISPIVKTLFEADSVSFHCHLLRGNISQLHVTWYEKAGDNPEKLLSDKNDSLSLNLKGTLPNRKDSHVSFYRCLVRNNDGVGSSPLAKLVILRKGYEAICASEESHGVTWSVTLAGMIDEQQCPYAIGQARRSCIKTGPKSTEWGEVDLSDCTSLQVREIHEEVIALTEGYTVSRTLSNMLEDLLNASKPYAAPSLEEKPRSMYVKDLATSVDALTRMIRYNAGQREKPLSNNHDISNLVKTSSNLLKLSNLPAWKSALKTTSDLAYQMISAIDEYGHHSINKTIDIHIEAANVVLIAVKVSVNSSTSAKGIQIIQGQSSLALPPTLFSQSNSSVTVVSVFFSSLGQILTSSEALNISYSSGSDWLINSQLASVTVRPSPPDVIQPPFKLALETNKVALAGAKRACVFLNLRTKNDTAWSTDGCNVVSSHTNRTTTSCACDHMTVFGILMEINDYKKEDIRHRAALSWISIVGCLLSLAGILITLLIMVCFWKNMRSPRTTVLVNLCVAIAVTDVLVVTMEIIDLESKTGCKVMAALLHFSFLSIFCWMLSEGVLLYFSLVKIIGTTVYANVQVFYAVGWGLPALVVSLTLIVTQGRGYADRQSCWLSMRNHMIWAFAAPALLIVCVNIVVFTLVIYSMLSSHRLRKEPLTRRFQRGLKASFVLFPVLGLSWSFAVLTMVTDEIVFNYIFAVLNSLQGFLIFIFHCVLNKQC